MISACMTVSVRELYGVPEGSKSTEVVDHSVYAYFDIHVYV